MILGLSRIYACSVSCVWLAVAASDRTVSLLELVVSSSSLQDNNVTWPSSLESFYGFTFQRKILFSFYFFLSLHSFFFLSSVFGISYLLRANRTYRKLVRFSKNVHAQCILRGGTKRKARNRVYVPPRPLYSVSSTDETPTARVSNYIRCIAAKTLN